MDKKVLRAFYDRYGPLVYRRARFLLGNHEDAEEALQEVFIRALKSDAVFEHPKQIFIWLNRITTNFCFNLIRDRATRKDLWREHLGHNPAPSAQSATMEDLSILRQLLAEADEQCARAALLVLLEGMSYSEAAAVLGVAKRTVGYLVERFQKWAQEHTAIAKPSLDD